ncbi:MAG: hypothetical protein ACW986_11715 [Promethearchaeota archaeon]|jgi:uroporphyrinogen decarboxylase
MNSRERVMIALNHAEPDKVPIDLGDNVTDIHISANVHNITAEVPPENIVALFDAIKDNRIYHSARNN